MVSILVLKRLLGVYSAMQADILGPSLVFKWSLWAYSYNQNGCRLTIPPSTDTRVDARTDSRTQRKKIQPGKGWIKEKKEQRVN